MANKEEKVCKKCSGTGWIYTKDSDYVKRCSCRISQYSELKFLRASIPNRYQKCTLDNFDTVENPSLDKALKKSVDFSIKFPACPKGILYMGPSGIGKTHLAIGVTKEILQKGADVKFYDFQDLLREIQDSYNPEADKTEFNLLEPVIKAEVIVLDDVGSKKTTEWVRDTLAYIINYRYNNQLLTIMTTNYLDEDKSNDNLTLSDRVGARLRSRLYEMCDTLYMEGDDFRRVIRQHR